MTKAQLRINKYLSICGLGSRRKTEELIKKGLISINGKPVFDLACRIDVDSDIVMYNKKVLSPEQTYHYIILNKPRGYITTAADELSRKTVLELLPGNYAKQGVFPVGRLDKDSEGLLLFTNDGDLAYKLTHPRFNVPKAYQVILDRPLRDDHRVRIENGIKLYGSMTSPASISAANEEWTGVVITITEGKKRQVRLMFSMLGYEVTGLTRIRYGPITLGALPKGKCRILNKQEIKKLKSAVN